MTDYEMRKDKNMPELSDEIKDDRLEIDTTEAGLTEILAEDRLTTERIKADLAKNKMDRECELRELSRLMNVGIVVHELHFMKIVCEPVTGKLAAVEFLGIDRQRNIWIRPGGDFDFVFERLWRLPSDAEIAGVTAEAEQLGCRYVGWQMDEGHCICDVAETKSSFTVEPGRPVFNALMECRDKFGNKATELNHGFHG